MRNFRSFTSSIGAVVFIKFVLLTSVFLFPKELSSQMLPQVELSLYRNPTTLENISRVHSISVQEADKYFLEWAKVFGMNMTTQSLSFDLNETVGLEVFYTQSLSTVADYSYQSDIKYSICLDPIQSPLDIKSSDDIFKSSSVQIALINLLPDSIPHRLELFSVILSDSYISNDRYLKSKPDYVSSSNEELESVFLVQPVFDFTDCEITKLERYILTNPHRVVNTYSVNFENLNYSAYRNSSAGMLVLYILSNKLDIPLSDLLLFEVSGADSEVRFAYSISSGVPMIHKLNGFKFVPACDLKEVVIKRSFSKPFYPDVVKLNEDRIVARFFDQIVDYFKQEYPKATLTLLPGAVRGKIILSDVSVVSKEGYWEKLQFIPQSSFVIQDDLYTLRVLIYVDGDYIESTSENPPSEYRPVDTYDLTRTYPGILVSKSHEVFTKILKSIPENEFFNHIPNVNIFNSKG